MARKNPEKEEKVKKDTLTRLAEVMEKSRVLENLEMILDRRKLLWNNFLAGLARGLGFGVGLTVLAALVIYLLVMLLKSIVALDIPLIGTYIADIVEIVQEQISNHP
jgi:hypothetical protein